jgi:hypothetical protein
VQQVLSLQQDAHPEPLGETSALGHRRRAAPIGGEQTVEGCEEPGIAEASSKARLQLLAGSDERLGYVAPAEVAEASRSGGHPEPRESLSFAWFITDSLRPQWKTSRRPGWRAGISISLTFEGTSRDERHSSSSQS